MTSTAPPKRPDVYVLGQELNWSAPWVDVQIWVELPFWLMVNNSTISAEVNRHEFQVEVHDNYFELNVREITDSRTTVCYQGPLRTADKLSKDVQQLQKERPDLPFMWRKCKTVLKIKSRCNEMVWNATEANTAVHVYRAELCRAHISIVNALIQQYRLATYDYFVYDLSPWDIPRWGIERDGRYVASFLVPYREWDIKPVMSRSSRGIELYELIEASELQKQMSVRATAGEYELLDAINLMERGNYSGAVRRVTTAIEVVVEDVLGKELEAAVGKQSAAKFLNDTKTNFDRRVKKYEQLSRRMLPEALRKDLRIIRTLRHRIVHRGYRIDFPERGRGQRSVDTGRWIFNWFENEAARTKIRETKMTFRGLGHDLSAGIFSPEITPEGVVLSPVWRQLGFNELPK
jgi:hypothetical protein